jgi:hypothetical protein
VAIRERNVVVFRYRGVPRIVQPHAIFVATTGTHCLDAVQVGGGTSSGGLPGWRRFDLNAIEAVTIRDERFEVARDFSERARDYRRGIVVESVTRVQ